MKAVIKQPERLLALDSMRGLAAFTVVIYHLIVIFPVGASLDSGAPSENVLLNILTFTPLHLFWQGHEAVYFFFVLSGFVLSLPFLNSSRVSIAGYYIKRFFRIYPPYIVAVLLAVLASKQFYQGPINELSDYFNCQWRGGIDWLLVIKHFSLVGSFDWARFDLPIWSLVIEMRISILFPMIVWLVCKYDWKISLVAALVPSAIYFIIWRQQIHSLVEVHHNYFITLRFISFFIIGSALAKYRIGLIKFFQEIGRPRKIIFLLLSILAYTNTYWLHYSWIWYLPGLHSIALRSFAEDLMVGVGIGGIIVVVLGSRFIGDALGGGLFTFLGKVSYSLYLYHSICLLSLMCLFYGKIPTLAILGLAVVLSLLLAVGGYYLVELPAMNLGRHLATSIKNGLSKIS